MSVRTHSFLCSRALCRAVLTTGMVFTAFAQAQVSLTQLSHRHSKPARYRGRAQYVLVWLNDCERLSGGSDLEWRRRRHWVRDFDQWRCELDQRVSAGNYDVPGRNELGGQ